MQQPLEESPNQQPPNAIRGSCSVNQPTERINRGKEKMQDNKEDEEKPKMLKIWDDQGWMKILRKPPDIPYTVEFPDEEDNLQGMEQVQGCDGNKEEELALKISHREKGRRPVKCK
ncbi:hypothetical protein PIB30_021130 [Stylosanthes scabra]|uniref:Uncharacterized protein n=1 Tax=Stylosanthes scabra TaxID=79078 RepID=A0ABU6QAA5_9FABA|nr:hypothetical protein [Stylosanthes scabra]